MKKMLKDRNRICGLAILFVVFALSSEWVRSYDPTPPVFPRQLILDKDRFRVSFSFDRIDRKFDRLYSLDGCLVWDAIVCDAPMTVYDNVAVWTSGTNKHTPDFRKSSDAWEWRWRWHGFENGVFSFKGPYDFRLARWSVPYWTIVVPLLMLSAWILLSKRQGRTSDRVQSSGIPNEEVPIDKVPVESPPKLR